MPSLGELLSDSLNGFAVSDFPLLFLQVFSSTALLVCGVLATRKYSLTRRDLLTAASLTLLISLCKNSIPLSVILLALAVIVASPLKKLVSDKENVTLLLAVVCGIGCGTGFLLPFASVYLFVICPVLLLMK